MKPPGPPPPPPPRPASWGPNPNLQSGIQTDASLLKQGQIQFLKKILDEPLTREFLDYYKNLQYYQVLVGGDVEEFLLKLLAHGYLEKVSENPETWSCTEKGRQAATMLVRQARSSPQDLEKALSELNANESLKIATEFKRDGNLAAAIEVLEISYNKIKSTIVSYGVETFLRLPSYLKSAGRRDEAWAALNRLLAMGYPNQLASRAHVALDRSKIYKSMSKFLHEEGKHRYAISCKALSMISQAQYYFFQVKEYSMPYDKELRKESRESLARFSRPVALLEELRKSVPKKAGEYSLEAVIDYVSKALKDPGRIDHGAALLEIEEILLAHPQEES